MPAGKTYVKIASQTLGSAVSSVTFSNLPQNYTDLIIVGTKQANNNSSFTPSPALRFNEDTGSNYSSTLLDGNGTAASSNRYTSGTRLLLGYAIGIGLNSDAIVIWQIQNYSNSTTYKTVLGRLSNPTTGTAPGAGVGVGLWRNTSAITSITLSPGEQTWSSGAGFTIYGIECAKSPKAEGGDVIVSDGTYWYHAFRYSGLFVPKQSLTADYVVVAGGGGGGRRWDSTEPGGGGGGAGGFRTSIGGSTLSLNGSTGYTVTIGGGGSGGNTGNPGNGYKGSNSVFSTITATGGGYGGGYLNSGGTGGSAGGHGRDRTAAVTAGNEGGYSPVEGYAGGRSTSGGNGTGCGGGGGAGGAGNDGNSSVAGAGGIGTYNAITNAVGIGQVSGGNYYVAGGGGGTYASGSGNGTGAAGGTGGGGKGADNYNSTAGAGTTNTGGGGGGGGGSSDVTVGLGGNGGSGIVIVRYAV